MKFKSFNNFVNESQINENIEMLQSLMAFDNLVSIFNVGPELGIIGGSVAAGYVISWIKNLRNEHKEAKIKEIVKTVANKLEDSSKYRMIINSIKNVPYIKNPTTKLEHDQNTKRLHLVKSLIIEVKSLLTKDELKFFKEIKDLIKEKDIEEIIGGTSADALR